MHRHTCVAVATVLLVLSVPGCGDGEGDGSTAGAGPADESTQPTEPSSSGEPSTAATTPPSEALEKIRVVGEVIEVGDCVVVQDDNAITWTVTGEGSGELEIGDRVQVTGTPDLRAPGCGGPVVQATRIVAP